MRQFPKFFSLDNPKAVKARGYGYLNAINYMAPANTAGVGNLCSHHTAPGERLVLGQPCQPTPRPRRVGGVYCADGMRALGTSAKAIREAMAAVEKLGKVVVDAARDQRSDKLRWEMYDWACGKVVAEKAGLTPAKSRKGGQTRAAMMAHDRLEDEKAERIWKDQRFTSNAEACEYMNKLHPPKLSKGWHPQLAYQHFGESGRPRGNKSFKLNKRK